MGTFGAEDSSNMSRLSRISTKVEIKSSSAKARYLGSLDKGYRALKAPFHSHIH